MKVIIAGSRGVPEQVRQCKAAVLDFEQRYGRITEVVSGCARGADRVGELFAEMRQIPVDKYPADWNTHGKRAGIIRNSQMANVAQGLIALWDEKSPGTRNMIETARNKKLQIVVWNYLTNKKVMIE
jgi:YspA, cpYpsA-related SLOG family